MHVRKSAHACDRRHKAMITSVCRGVVLFFRIALSVATSDWHAHHFAALRSLHRSMEVSQVDTLKRRRQRSSVGVPCRAFAASPSRITRLLCNLVADASLTVCSNEKLDDDVDAPPLSAAAQPPKPAPSSQRAPLRPGDLQKWVQCARCSQWRKVRRRGTQGRRQGSAYLGVHSGHQLCSTSLCKVPAQNCAWGCGCRPVLTCSWGRKCTVRRQPCSQLAVSVWPPSCWCSTAVSDN